MSLVLWLDPADLKQSNLLVSSLEKRLNLIFLIAIL